jgi:hypothetical protein
MVVIVLLKGKHLIIEFPCLVPSFQIFLQIEKVLHIFIEDVDNCSPLLEDLVDLIGVEVGLRGGVLLVEGPLNVVDGWFAAGLAHQGFDYTD